MRLRYRYKIIHLTLGQEILAAVVTKVPHSDTLPSAPLPSFSLLYSLSPFYLLLLSPSIQLRFSWRVAGWQRQKYTIVISFTEIQRTTVTTRTWRNASSQVGVWAELTFHPTVRKYLVTKQHMYMYTTCMWQSRVEIEHYSIAYFDRVTTFKALQHRTSVKGGAHMHSDDA